MNTDERRVPPNSIIHGDCLEVMRGWPDNCVDLIATDPPYFKVKNEPWDRQWDKPKGFLSWLDRVLAEFHRLLKPNGSLYIFASPKMGARVECLVAERFAPLNRIRWIKKVGWHKKARKQHLRSYLSPWEECIFAEHYGADNIAKGEMGYVAKCDSLRGFVFEPLRAYLANEWKRAGLKNEDANLACGTASMAARHYFSRSQWALPTAPHYRALQDFANRGANGFGPWYLRREYEVLRREYEDLRREYEDLRREYEDLRRPFSVTTDVPHTDVWTFPPVQAYSGKHPCEKPLAMMEHIVRTSSRPGVLICDPFCGSGTTCAAARHLGRRYIGIELSGDYCEIARQRVANTEKNLFAEAER